MEVENVDAGTPIRGGMEDETERAAEVQPECGFAFAMQGRSLHLEQHTATAGTSGSSLRRHTRRRRDRWLDSERQLVGVLHGSVAHYPPKCPNSLRRAPCDRSPKYLAYLPIGTRGRKLPQETPKPQLMTLPH